MNLKKLLVITITLSACFGFSQTVPNYVPTSGLVGWYPFNGNANDQSGSGNNGLMKNGATFINDRHGNVNESALLDGVNDYIEMPSGNGTSLDVTGDFTVSCWIKTNDSEGALLCMGDNVNLNSGGYLSNINGGNVGLNKLGVSTRGAWTGSVGSISDNTWHNIVYTLESGTLKIYYDNNLDVQATGIQSPLSWNGLRTIGVGQDLLMISSKIYSGLIDDIGIWNRALTQTEVTQLFTSTLSVDTFTSLNSIKFYPNPIVSDLNIDLGDNTDCQIKIYNQLGKRVFQSTSKDSGLVRISLDEGSSGVYFLNVFNADGELIKTSKVIKE